MPSACGMVQRGVAVNYALFQAELEAANAACQISGPCSWVRKCFERVERATEEGVSLEIPREG